MDDTGEFNDFESHPLPAEIPQAPAPARRPHTRSLTRALAPKLRPEHSQKEIDAVIEQIGTAGMNLDDLPRMDLPVRGEVDEAEEVDAARVWAGGVGAKERGPGFTPAAPIDATGEGVSTAGMENFEVMKDGDLVDMDGGGRKSRKRKSRKGKSRKRKSRKGKSRKGKSRKGKSRKRKSRKGKSRKRKSKRRNR